MKKLTEALLGLIFLLGIQAAAFAQTHRQDVVYLNNGSVLRGTILEYIVDSHVKIETYGGNVWVFDAAEIKSIEKEDAPDLRNRQSSFAHDGYSVMLGTGIGIGSSSSAGLSFVTGYFFSPKLSAGIGLGIEAYDEVVIPFWLDTRYFLSTNKTSPFAYAQAGYALQTQQNYYYNDRNNKGGALVAGGLGMRWLLRGSAAFYVSGGYRFQQLRSTETWYWDGSSSVETIYNMYRAELKIGFMFN